jgi:protein TilB
LDLTVNFVDVDTLEESVTHLRGLPRLRELFLMGNPCTDWAEWRLFVVGSVPQLGTLDGEEITRAERVRASQAVPRLRAELRPLAAAKAREWASREAEEATERSKPLPAKKEHDEEEENAEWTPAERLRTYRAMAADRLAEEERRRALEPAQRDAEVEHARRLAEERRRQELEGEVSVRQKNEGGWEFKLEDEDGYGRVVLRLQLPRFLDSSLVDVDATPSFVRVVVKGKVFCLRWPEEVRSDAGVARRSKTTGELVLTVPKVHRNPLLERVVRTRRGDREGGEVGGGEGDEGGEEGEEATAREGRTRRFQAAESVSDAMLRTCGVEVSRGDAGGVESGREKMRDADVDKAKPVDESSLGSLLAKGEGADIVARVTRRIQEASRKEGPKGGGGGGAGGGPPSAGKKSVGGKYVPSFVPPSVLGQSKPKAFDDDDDEDTDSVFKVPSKKVCVERERKGEEDREIQLGSRSCSLTSTYLSLIQEWIRSKSLIILSIPAKYCVTFCAIQASVLKSLYS